MAFSDYVGARKEPPSKSRPDTRFLFDASGLSAAEYAVLLAMIMLSILGVIGVVGNQAGGMWGNIKGDLDNHGFGAPPPGN